MSTIHKDRVLILGAGPAGYTAALYAARANLEPHLVTGSLPGGQLTTTTDVENWPSEINVQGPALVERMRSHAKHFGTKLSHDEIVSVDLSWRPFRCVGDSGDVYICQTLVIATGANAKWLGLPSETHFRGHGVSACATCDGFFFRGKRVVVVGGGNAAVEEALYLTNHASQVTIVHRRDSFRAERITQDRISRNSKISVAWNSVIDEIVGTDDPHTVTGVVLRNSRTGERVLHETDGVFVAIGHRPATELFKGQLETDRDGYLVTAPHSTATSVQGVFAAGDVRDKVFRQAVTAAGMGCMAALEADRFLTQHSVLPWPSLEDKENIARSHAQAIGPETSKSLANRLLYWRSR